MKYIIQCCASKDDILKNTFKYNGKIIKFVSHPKLIFMTDRNILFVRPDDLIPDTNLTWRDHLLFYNKEHHKDNPDKLKFATDLYEPKIYSQLVNKFGWKNVYILSAGWGLIPSNFRIPGYDITYSSQAPKYAHRLHSDVFNDFNFLPSESFCFLGGKDYLPLLYNLTKNIPHESIRKIIFTKGTIDKKVEGYEYIHYETKRSTNWHYDCGKSLVLGDITI